MPLTPTFTVVDNADGTATVTIAGSTGGAANEVRTINIDSQYEHASEWATSGSRTGDGTVSVTLRPGIYYFTIKSTAAGNDSWAVPRPYPVRDARVIVLDAILDASQARVRTMNLVPPKRVMDQTAMDTAMVQGVKEQCIVIAPHPDMAVDVDVDHPPLQRDQIAYPIIVAYLAPAVGDFAVKHSPANRKLWYGMVQDLRRAFINNSIEVSGATVYDCRFRPLRAAEMHYWGKGFFVSGGVATFLSREPRGVGS